MEITKKILIKIEQVESIVRQFNPSAEPFEEVLSNSVDPSIRLSYFANNKLLQFDIYQDEEFEIEWYFREHETKQSKIGLIQSDHPDQELVDCIKKLYNL